MLCVLLHMGKQRSRLTRIGDFSPEDVIPQGKEKSYKVFVLEETTREELYQVRKTSVTNKKMNPVLIYKKGNSLYVTEIPKNFADSSEYFNPNTSCGSCQYAYAKPESQGGCNKILNWPMKEKLGKRMNVSELKAIEYFEQIEEGYETVGLNDDAFTIIKCIRFVSDMNTRAANVTKT